MMTDGGRDPGQSRSESVAEQVSGAASRTILQMLGDRGIPANEVVVTKAERRGTGEGAAWVVSVLRGRERATHRFGPELVEKVLTQGPDRAWRDEIRQMLEQVGVVFP